MDIRKLNPSREVRAWAYGVAVAACGLMVGYGLLTEQMALLWLALASAILNGMALANVPDPAPGEHRE